MTDPGWTIDMACGEFAKAGMPVDRKGFQALVTAARRTGNLKPLGEVRKPPGSEGGRGSMLYPIGELQQMHADSVRWLAVQNGEP